MAMRQVDIRYVQGYELSLGRYGDYRCQVYMTWPEMSETDVRAATAQSDAGME